MRPVQQALCAPLHANETPPRSHRREAFPVLPLPQEVHPGVSAGKTREDAHGGETVPLLSVWQELLVAGRTLKASPLARGRQALRLPPVRQKVQKQENPAGTHRLPQRRPPLPLQLLREGLCQTVRANQAQPHPHGGAALPL